jgi:hypothetical protein
MASDARELLEYLKFELQFLEDGGYGRSPHTPWRPSLVFEDSPSCLNFNDPGRPHPCTECRLMQFVPEPAREQQVPCRHIPLTEAGQTVDYYYQYGTQVELEESLKKWLQKQIQRIEKEQGQAA